MRELIDPEDGENQAVRSFLMQYSCDRSISVKDMQDHMRRSGWDGCWPKWTTMHQGHLTKGGAQDWIRFLFSLEPKSDRIAALEKQNAELLAALQAERNKQSASYCKDGDRCVCGGDLPRVRECCGNWVNAIQPSTNQEVSK